MMLEGIKNKVIGDLTIFICKAEEDKLLDDATILYHEDVPRFQDRRAGVS